MIMQKRYKRNDNDTNKNTQSWILSHTSCSSFCRFENNNNNDDDDDDSTRARSTTGIDQGIARVVESLPVGGHDGQLPWMVCLRVLYERPVCVCCQPSRLCREYLAELWGRQASISRSMAGPAVTVAVIIITATATTSTTTEQHRRSIGDSTTGTQFVDMFGALVGSAGPSGVDAADV